MRICAIALPLMGLGNRLKALLSAMRIANETQNSFSLYWPVTDVVPCRFEDLFELQVEKEDEPGMGMCYCSWRLWVNNPELPAGWARAYPSADVNGRAIDLEYDRIPAAMRTVYIQQLARLRPHGDIVRRAKESAVGPFVAVHIRGGDDWEAFGRSIPLEHFFRAMDQFPANTRFFVSCHVRGTVEGMLERYPNRIIHQVDKVYSGQSIRRMQDALVDLMCLSTGTELIGTFGSTFTEMAWWFGACRQRVTIVEPDKSGFKWS
jgi:hypothetical protein